MPSDSPSSIPTHLMPGRVTFRPSVTNTVSPWNRLPKKPAMTPSPEELTALSLSKIAAGIRSGSVTSTEVTQACLARIATYGPKLDAFITVMKAGALAQAQQLDAEQKAGKLRGPLHGVPVALKDNIDTAGTRTTAASALFEDRVPSVDPLKAADYIRAKWNLQRRPIGGRFLYRFRPGGAADSAHPAALVGRVAQARPRSPADGCFHHLELRSVRYPTACRRCRFPAASARAVCPSG